MADMDRTRLSYKCQDRTENEGHGRNPSSNENRGEIWCGKASLLIKNLPRYCRPQDLHLLFERFGPIKDVYLPRNYHTGEPRGFGFVEYRNPRDAAEALDHMDEVNLDGRELHVVFATQNRKKPQEMRSLEQRRGLLPSEREQECQRSRSPEKTRLRSCVFSVPSTSDHRSRSYTPTDRAHSRSLSPSIGNSRRGSRNFRKSSRSLSPAPMKQRVQNGITAITFP